MHVPKQMGRGMGFKKHGGLGEVSHRLKQTPGNYDALLLKQVGERRPY